MTMERERVRTSVTIDRQLWQRFKAAAALEDKDMSAVLEQLIKQYVAEHLGPQAHREERYDGTL